jgi:hypothetical protein
MPLRPAKSGEGVDQYVTNKQEMAFFQVCILV